MTIPRSDPLRPKPRRGIPQRAVTAEKLREATVNAAEIKGIPVDSGFADGNVAVYRGGRFMPEAQSGSGGGGGGVAITPRYNIYGTDILDSWLEGAAIASAATLTLGTDGDMFHVTGTTGITAIATPTRQTLALLIFDGACLLTNGANLILAGGINFTTAAGVCIIFAWEGGTVWREVSRLAARPAAPDNARYFTLGLNSALTNEHSLDEADESTLTSGKDIFWKWNDGGSSRKFKIHDIGGDFTLELRGVSGVVLGLGYVSDAYPRIQLTQDGELHMGDGTGPPGAKLVSGLAGVIQVPGSTKFQVVGALAYLPTPLNIVAANTQIPPNSLVELTANASYTLTSTPTLQTGDNGQQCLIRCVDTVDVITLQDQGTLAGSNLRLGAATRALGPRDSILLVYSDAVGDWTEIVYNTVI